MRPWPIATIVFGLATLAIAIGFSYLPEVAAVYPPGAFGPALSAFQRATTMEELAAVFGAPADPAILAAMHAGNTLDLYAFIPAYTIFSIAAAIMLAGGVRRPWVFAAITLTLVGAIADVFETWTQLRMTGNWLTADTLMPAVAPLCWTKYFGLAFAALAISAICFTSERKRWIIGALGFVPLAATFAAWTEAVQIPTLLTIGLGGFWVALIVVAVMELWRKPEEASA